MCIISGGAKSADCPIMAIRRQQGLENSRESGCENEKGRQDVVTKGRETDRGQYLDAGQGLVRGGAEEMDARAGMMEVK